MNKIYINIILMVFLLSCQTKIDKKELLELTVEEMNKNCPVYIDNITVLDSSIVKFNNYEYILNYCFTLNVDKTELEIQNFYFEQKKHLQNEYDNNNGLKTFRELNIPLEYTYFDKNQNQIVSILVFNKSSE